MDCPTGWLIAGEMLWNSFGHFSHPSGGGIGPDSIQSGFSQMSLVGPTVSTWALQRVDSFLRYTGRHANVVATAP
jgi:hypothetical protein